MRGYQTHAEWCRAVYGRLKLHGIHSANIKDLSVATAYLEHDEHDIYHKKLAEIINDDPGIVVDMGCGSGWLQKHLKGCVYTGVDIAPNESSKGQPWFVEALKQDTGLPGSEVDYIVFSRSLWCDSAMHGSLREAHRLLKDGAILLIREQVGRKPWELSRLHHLQEFGFEPYLVFKDGEDSFVNSKVYKGIDHHNNTYYTGLFAYKKV